MAFDRNVFVNCPFDDDYLPLLRSLLFTIIYLGFTPRIALEELDSGSPRLDKIVNLIAGSRYAIHDLSRLQAKEAGEYYRLNMPFELGIDVGCRLFKMGRCARKKCLVLESERYRYQAAISDMSSSDIASHGDSPIAVAAEVRNWLASQTRERAPGPSRVWAAFLTFTADNRGDLERRGFSETDIERVPVSELMDSIGRWVDSQPRAGGSRSSMR